jgi:hypothetical protein
MVTDDKVYYVVAFGEVSYKPGQLHFVNWTVIIPNVTSDATMDLFVAAYKRDFHKEGELVVHKMHSQLQREMTDSLTRVSEVKEMHNSVQEMVSLPKPIPIGLHEWLASVSTAQLDRALDQLEFNYQLPTTVVSDLFALPGTHRLTEVRSTGFQLTPGGNVWRKVTSARVPGREARAFKPY